MMKSWFVWVAAFSIALAVPAEARPKPPRQADIVAAMQDSAAGWNAGDIDRFMALYSDSAETSFVSGNAVLRGKAAIAEHYRKGFNFADAAKRGMLSFDSLDFRALGPDTALYIARYTLAFADGKTASGITTVIFRREGKVWRLIADHSS